MELLKRMSLVRLPESHKPGGISPDNEFDDTSNHCKGEFFPRLTGREPSNKFFHSSSTSKLVNWPSLLGMGPVS
uniref:Uncharacterized protein n=1 Tax=Rhizophora mucronata TaxID=61149 RepID=A0A2P2NPU9_RHIMU